MILQKGKLGKDRPERALPAFGGMRDRSCISFCKAALCFKVVGRCPTPRKLLKKVAASRWDAFSD